MQDQSAVFFSRASTGGEAPWAARQRTWALLDALAIGLWATWPVLSLQTRELPPVERDGCGTKAFGGAIAAYWL